MPKPRKKKAVKRPKLEDIELHPDGWERFEKGIKQIAQVKKSPVSSPSKNRRGVS